MKTNNVIKQVIGRAFAGGTIALCVSAALATTNERAENQASSATAFSCEGTYLKFNEDTGKHLVTGALGLKATDDARMDGCLAYSINADKTTGVIYAVLPKEARTDAEERRHYRLVALDPESLDTVAQYDIPGRLEDVPEITLDRSQGLLLKYDEKAIRFSTKRSTLLTTLSKQPSSTAAAASSAPINGLSLLDDATRKKFDALVRTNASGKKYLDVLAAGSAAGRTIYTVAADNIVNRSPISGILVYDNAAKRVISAFLAKYAIARSNIGADTPTVHLTPDGRRVIVEEYSWKQNDPGVAPEVIKTGTMAIYNADSGGLQSIVSLNPAPEGGYAHVLNFSEDGGALYYASRDHLYVIDVVAGRVRSTTNLPSQFDPVYVVSAK
jgi:hypothetical protein